MSGIAVPGVKAQFATIAKPTIIATPALPELAEIKPQKMAKHLEMKLPPEELNATRRVFAADVDNLCRASFPHFQKKFPRLEVENFIRFVNSSLWDNRWKFLQTDDAWGAAEAVRTFWEPEITVEVRWLQRLNSKTIDAAALIHAFEFWARSINAVKLVLWEMPGIDLPSYAKNLGIDGRATQYIKVL